MNHMRALRTSENGTGPITFIASTSGIKRDGMDLDPNRWYLENYRRNPVVLWSHAYGGQNLPIGRASVEIKESNLLAQVTFDKGDSFAKEVERKYREGYLNAVSVGWLDIAHCKKCGKSLDRFSISNLESYRKKCPHCNAELTKSSVEIKYDLLDISAVSVPADPDALAVIRTLERSRAENILVLSVATTIQKTILQKIKEEEFSLNLLALKLQTARLRQIYSQGSRHRLI